MLLCHDGREEQRTTLITRVMRGVQKPSNQQLLRMEFTSEHDPFFLYYLEVCEDAFHELKQEQSLRVDFAMFPTKLIELLNFCAQTNDEETLRYTFTEMLMPPLSFPVPCSSVSHPTWLGSQRLCGFRVLEQCSRYYRRTSSRTCCICRCASVRATMTTSNVFYPHACTNSRYSHPPCVTAIPTRCSHCRHVVPTFSGVHVSVPVFWLQLTTPAPPVPATHQHLLGLARIPSELSARKYAAQRHALIADSATRCCHPRVPEITGSAGRGGATPAPRVAESVKRTHGSNQQIEGRKLGAHSANATAACRSTGETPARK